MDYNKKYYISKKGENVNKLFVHSDPVLNGS